MKFSQKGFTLIELLVVVAIIGVLASVVLGALGDARAKARDARRHADIKTIQNALEMYYLDHGEYPIRNWIFSYSSTNWNILSNELGNKLPTDPINENTYPYSGGLSYAYYAGNQYNASYMNCPLGQFYLLVYNQEGITTSSQNIGVTRCDNGDQQRWGNNSITVGMSPAQ